MASSFSRRSAAETINATLEDNPAGQINRDSDLDAGVIVHEYGHGISNRLTGGPANTSCLGNQEQMGEGWSDWQTLFLHAAPSDTATTPRPVATYLTFEDAATGFGIRAFPYNTDNIANPLTYSDIPTQSVPHGVGAIWANMLWEMYWNLVGELGYDPDLYYGSGGNNIAYQLVLDGMKLQPVQPGLRHRPGCDSRRRPGELRRRSRLRHLERLRRARRRLRREPGRQHRARRRDGELRRCRPRAST